MTLTERLKIRVQKKDPCSGTSKIVREQDLKHDFHRDSQELRWVHMDLDHENDTYEKTVTEPETGAALPQAGTP